MKDCYFCKIVAGTIACHPIWEDERHLAFLSPSPNTPGATLVIPKAHHPNYAFELEDDTLSGLVIASKKVARLLDCALEDVAKTGLILEGHGTDHLHAKLIPMHGTRSASSFRPIPPALAKFFTRYEGYLSSHDARRCRDEDLMVLARRIRGFHGCPDKEKPCPKSRIAFAKQLGQTTQDCQVLN